jgi:hypothetical protein
MFFAEVLPSFDRSASDLLHFTEAVPDFSAPAQRLETFSEIAPDFSRSVSMITERGSKITDAATSLDRLANQIDLPRMENLVGRLEAAINRVPKSGPSAAPPHPATMQGATVARSRWSLDAAGVATALGVTALAGLAVGIIATWAIALHISDGTEQDRQACTGASRPRRPRSASASA